VIDWTKTLANIMYKHNENNINFTIKDVEEIHSYILELKSEIKELENSKKRVQASKAKAEQDYLKIVQKLKTDNLDNYKIDKKV